MITQIQSSDKQSVKSFLEKIYIPRSESHKGQNGKVLIIGGSKLFHAASLWAAEVASHFADMVHYGSSKENEEIFMHLKKTFRNGIAIPQKEIPYYLEEDEAILIGPGMVRDEKDYGECKVNSYEDILAIPEESQYTAYLTKYIIDTFPHKKIVFDAGSLQMMNPEWLLQMKQKPIITPHQIEFERLFGITVADKSLEEQIQIVKGKAKHYNCVIMLKAIHDIITDGEEVYIVKGGNAGLTKGGSGDILAGITVSLFAKNDAVTSVVLASFILKSTADELFKTQAFWYNMNDVIKKVPTILKKLLYN